MSKSTIHKIDNTYKNIASTQSLILSRCTARRKLLKDVRPARKSGSERVHLDPEIESHVKSGNFSRLELSERNWEGLNEVYSTCLRLAACRYLIGTQT